MRIGRSSRKPTLLAGCALAAWLAAQSGPAAAQALQGTPDIVGGTAGIAVAPGYTQVVPTSPQVVINWEPFDTGGSGTIDFLPVGMLVEFAEVTGTFDYTVLNRILPVDGTGGAVSRAVAFNGEVFSRIGNFPGGNVWFYSPTGIIAGPTAVFNVGGLILTTNDVPFIAGGPGPIFGPGGTVQFQGPAGSTGFVDVRSGAQITANAGPFGAGYVALIAPRVVQAGQVNANGQIAYIAAEQLDMTINGGLFDFTLTVGTTDANGVVHTGTSTGPASTGLADQQRLSVVALPKNDALTMLLSGSIGYAPAASVFNDGSTIVLAAGFDSDDPTAAPLAALGSLTIDDAATFRNPLTAYASSAIAIDPGAGTVAFEGPATLYASNSIGVIADAGEQITAASDLALYSGMPGTGGSIDMLALGTGTIDVANTLIANASSGAALYVAAPSFLDATGGQIDISADGGTMAALNFIANAEGIGSDGVTTAGSGTGGGIDLQVLGGGTIAAGLVDLSALGAGGASAALAGNGTGGTVNLAEAGGLLDFGSVFVSAQGRGGEGNQGGDATGGRIDISIAGQAQNWNELIGIADAAAGDRNDPAGTTGGATALADGIDLAITGPGSLALLGDLVLTANSFMGVNAAPLRSGQAGGVDVTVGGGGQLAVGGTFFSHASALFYADLGDPAPLTSPVQQGGAVSILADGGRIAAAGLNVGANAVAASATSSAGAATGGSAFVSAIGGGAITIDNGLGTAVAEIAADGYGAPGPVPGDASGGIARLVAEDGSIDVLGNIEVSASGVVGEFFAPPLDGPGFAATGGDAALELRAGALGTAAIAANDIGVLANGDGRFQLVAGTLLPGGDPIVGDGGAGSGGTAGLIIDGGTLTVTSVLLEANGAGGASTPSGGATAFQTGNGTGGTSQLVQTGGTADIVTLQLVSTGQGGGGAPAAMGGELAALAGDGTGGISLIDLGGNGTLRVTDATLDARGYGANGMSHSGTGAASDGGNGTGGHASIVAAGGWTGSFSSGNTLILMSDGVGGDGGASASDTDGDGGDGTGLAATIGLADGAFALGAVTIEASGTGGNGAIGGTGIGGLASFALVDTAAGPVGTRELDNLTISANGNAGLSGGVFPEQSDAGDVLLEVRALDAASAMVISGSVVLNSFGGTIGTFSGVTVDISGAPLTIGGNLTIEAGEIDITADAAMLAAADAFMSAERTFLSTGLIGTDGALTVQANLGVDSGRLSSSGNTFLSGGTGPLVVADLAATGPVAAFGRSIDITSLGALTFADLDATAGDLSVTTGGNLALATADATGAMTLASTGGSIAATGAVNAGGAISADGAGGVAFSSLASGGTTFLRATGGAVDVDSLTSPGAVSAFGQSVDIVSPGALTFANLVSTAGPASVLTAGNLSLSGANAAGPITLRSIDGSIAATGPINATGNASLQGLLGVTASFLNSGGTTALRSGPAGAININTLVSTGSVSVNGGTVNIAGSGALNFVEAVAAGAMSIQASGNLAFTEVTAGNDLILNSIGGSLTAIGDVTGLFANLTAAGDILLQGNLNSGGNLLVDAGGGFTAEGATFTGDANIFADAGIAMASLSSGEITRLEAPNGNIVVPELRTGGRVTAIGLDVDIASTGGLQFDEARALIDDVRMVTAGGLTIGETSAMNEIALDSGGTFTLTGEARALSIDVTSSDIVLGDDARLGVRGATGNLTLRNGDATSETFIGGAGGAGYSLDADEAARMSVDETITILTGGNITIGDLALTFGSGAANIGAGGVLEISSPAVIAITGNVALATSSADDTFLIDPTLIQLNTDTGSIAMLGADGAPLGRLQMIGDAVAVATGNTLGQLATATDMAAINALLDTPGGTGQPLRAGTMTFDVLDALYIQNSGTSDAFADRRGFSASAVEIATESNGTRIVINGQILTAGGPVGGLDTAALIRIEGAVPATGGPFGPLSSINGCVIGANCAFVPPPPEPERPGFTPPTSEDVDPIPPDTGPGTLFVAPLIELAGTEPLVAPPLVDEPITGVGNDDLWEPRCGLDDEDGACRKDGSEP